MRKSFVEVQISNPLRDPDYYTEIGGRRTEGAFRMFGTSRPWLDLVCISNHPGVLKLLEQNGH